MLEQLCKALGWQGGTIHQVLDEIARLRKAEGLLRACQDRMKFEANSEGGMHQHIDNEMARSSAAQSARRDRHPICEADGCELLYPREQSSDAECGNREARRGVEPPKSSAPAAPVSERQARDTAHTRWSLKLMDEVRAHGHHMSNVEILAMLATPSPDGNDREQGGAK